MTEFTVEIDERNKTAILIVNGWEMFVSYDRAREITADSPEVKILKRIK